MRIAVPALEAQNNETVCNMRSRWTMSRQPALLARARARGQPMTNLHYDIFLGRPDACTQAGGMRRVHQILHHFLRPLLIGIYKIAVALLHGGEFI